MFLLISKKRTNRLTYKYLSRINFVNIFPNEAVPPKIKIDLLFKFKLNSFTVIQIKHKNTNDYLQKGSLVDLLILLKFVLVKFYKMNIDESLKCLQENKVLLYPTDTVWGIGCDATDSVAVAKIYKIKKREESKSLILLVSSLHMLQRYVKAIPAKAVEILAKAQNPTTIIYRNPEGLAKNTIAPDQTIAIRIVKSGFCHELIRRFDKPIVSTSANASGKPTPKSFSEISPAILESVDYVVALHQNQTAEKPSTILRITEAGDIAILRE